MFQVLLVEDDEINRTVTRVRLENHGHRVEVAVDGFEAIRLAAERDYDVILMDIAMPNMDGMEACSKIRGLQDKTRAMVPIIALTANSFPDFDKKLAEFGFDGLIRKPALTADLLETIAAVTQRDRRQGLMERF